MSHSNNPEWTKSHSVYASLPASEPRIKISRRSMLCGLSAAVLTPGVGRHRGDVLAQHNLAAGKIILKTGEKVPPVGMGTWLTFDIDPQGRELASRQKVLETFIRFGGGMIDSSPMYGRSEEVIGILAGRVSSTERLFSATKIWSAFESRGPTQLAASHLLWKQTPLDLVHVHNLLRWKTHLKMLQSSKESGSIRYVGLTTSHGRRHDEMEQLIKTKDIDAVQFTYNIGDRQAENRLLPAAMDKGLAVVINRPFATGQLFKRFAHHSLPEWASEIECQSWAEYFLKFIISHPAVTCAIPATRRPDHMIENMRAGIGRLPAKKYRQKMIDYIESL